MYSALNNNKWLESECRLPKTELFSKFMSFSERPFAFIAKGNFLLDLLVSGQEHAQIS